MTDTGRGSMVGEGWGERSMGDNETSCGIEEGEAAFCVGVGFITMTTGGGSEARGGGKVPNGLNHMRIYVCKASMRQEIALSTTGMRRRMIEKMIKPRMDAISFFIKIISEEYQPCAFEIIAYEENW